SLITLIGFAPGCAMDAGAGDESNDDNPALEDGEPAKDPALVLPRLPNLVAVDSTGQVPQDPTSYCALDPYGNFLVRVKNTGNLASVPSVVLLQGGAGAPSFNVGGLSPGAAQTIVVPFWSFATCTPGCSFSITVDATNTNFEGDEQNTFYGYCIG